MFQFPASPAVGQLFTPASGVSYRFNGTGWIAVHDSFISIIPSAFVFPYVGTTLPEGFLWCDGAEHLIANYPALYAAIGLTPGEPHTPGYFRTPDMRGRVLAGLDNLGGTMGAAGRLTLAASGILSTVIGGYGGQQTVTLTTGQMPTHDHGTNTGTESAAHTHGGTTGSENADHTHSGTTNSENAAHTHNAASGAQFASNAFASAGWLAGVGVVGMHLEATGPETAAHEHTFTTGGISTVHQHGFLTGTESALHSHNILSDGGGAAHLNVQPTWMVNYIIKT